MSASLPLARTQSREVTASFRREILPPVAVDFRGKKLPGFSFARMSQHLWRQKTPASIAYYTTIPERTARDVIQKDRDPGSNPLVEVLDSDQGWRALCWIMRDSKQPWWLQTLQARECSAAYEARREQLHLPLPAPSHQPQTREFGSPNVGSKE